MDITDNTKVALKVGTFIAVAAFFIGVGIGIEKFNTHGAKISDLDKEVGEIRGGMLEMRREVATASANSQKAAEQALLANITLNDIAIALAKEGIDIPTANEVRRRNP